MLLKCATLAGMGLFDRFRFASSVATLGTGPSPVPVASPWSSNSHLASAILAESAGLTDERVNRATAMKVPAIAKGRALIVGTLSRQPLAKFRGPEQVAAEPWMYRTNTGQSPRTRMLWTLDDLIFNGSSLWAVQRGARDVILDAVRVPPDWWEVDADLRILVNGKHASEGEVILFEGPQDPLLEIAHDDILAARNMSRAWSERVAHPIPLTHLSVSDANAFYLTQDEVDQTVANWETARKAGGTAFTPAGMTASFPGTAASDLFIEGRNASRLDFANFLALPSALLEGTTATASLTYSTKEGARNELVDYCLSYWATPVEARLSQDDVVPAGSRTAFDLEYLSAPTQPAQGPASED